MQEWVFLKKNNLYDPFVGWEKNAQYRLQCTEYCCMQQASRLVQVTQNSKRILNLVVWTEKKKYKFSIE